MGGMSHFPERVIGSVGGIVYGALVHAGEALYDCFRRGFDLYAVNYASGVAGAALLVLNFHGGAGVLARAGRQFRFQGLEREIVNRRALTSDAVVVHRVGAVG